jgi:hypothetical protein
MIQKKLNFLLFFFISIYSSNNNFYSFFNFSNKFNDLYKEFFDKKPPLSYAKEVYWAMCPSIFLSTIGPFCFYLSSKLFKSNNIFIQKILNFFEFMSIIPGFVILARSGIENTINVFKRTEYFNPYLKDSLILDTTSILYKSTSNIVKNLDRIKPLFIFIHGSLDQNIEFLFRNFLRMDPSFEEINPYKFKLKKSKRYTNLFTFNWPGTISENTIEVGSLYLLNEIKKILSNVYYTNIVFIAHSNGGRIAIKSAKKLIDEKWIDAPIDLITFSTPMTDEIVDYLKNILLNQNNRLYAFYAPTDEVAIKDPSAGVSLCDWGRGTSDIRFLNKYNNIENRSDFMVWHKVKNRDGFWIPANHDSYLIPILDYILINNGYAEIIDRFNEFKEKKTVCFVK